MAKVNIISIRRTPSLATGRIGLTDTMVTFQVEGVGSDFVLIPDADAGAKAIEDAVRAKVASRHASEGSTFDV